MPFQAGRSVVIFPLASSSWLCTPCRLRICLPCCSCICCILTFNSSIPLSRLMTSRRNFSLACSKSFSFPLPKREPTPLAMAVAASVAMLLSLSVRISDFTCLSSCSARFTCCLYISLQHLCVEVQFLFLNDEIVSL